MTVQLDDRRPRWTATSGRGQAQAWPLQSGSAGGFGITARLGFNAGEFVDFILGWCGADFYHADIGQSIEPQPNPELGPGRWTPDVAR